MNQEIQHNQGPAHAKSSSKVKLVGKVLATVVLLALVATLLFLAYKALMPTSPYGSTASFPADSATWEENASSANGLSNAAQDVSPSDKAPVAESTTSLDPVVEKPEEALEAEGFPIPVIAEYNGVLIHSPIHVSQLEGILFHQASFETAFPLETQLPSADPETMLENPDYEIAATQPVGNAYMNALALHLWREDTPTEMDTSIDVGAEAGTQVYAPVTGTVVLVNTYNLYDTCEDYEIHIQPEGRPDLDVVEIHISNVEVKAGDQVIGGVTPIAQVRNLAAEDITDIQIGFYTKEGHGNHTHVQVNNADYPEYKETRLKDAYKVE